jgi:hypothetical protein
MAYSVFFCFYAASFSCRSLFSRLDRSSEFPESLLITESFLVRKSPVFFLI